MRKFVLQNRFTNYDTSSFKLYLSEIQNIKPLTVDEERDLLELLYDDNNGDFVRNELVLRNLRFVISVAKQYVNSENLVEDLVNEGNLGLIEASKRFDPTLGLRFFSYAVWWIRRSITIYLTNNKNIRIPHNKNFSLMKIQEYIDSFIQKNGRVCTEEELKEAKFLDKDISDYFLVEALKPSSMDISVKIENDELSGMISDTLESDLYNADDNVHLNDLRYKISCLLKTIKKDKERQIIVKLFGLDGNGEMSIQSVAYDMGMTTERIRQIKTSSLNKMREFSNILY